MSDFQQGVFFGATTVATISMIVGMWLQESLHRQWCKMFNRLLACCERLAERVTRPGDEADWWKDN